MDSFNQQFLYSISIIILGYLLKRFDIVREREGEGLTRIVLNVTLPCLLIVSFSEIALDPSLFLLVFIAMANGLFMAAVGLFVFRKENAKTKGMLAMMLPGFNIGLFAFPLVEGIWGSKGLKYFGMFDAGNAMVLFGLTYIIAAYFAAENSKPDFRRIAIKISTSIPLLTYIIVSVLNIADVQLPNLVLDVSGIIADANMPLSLLILGIYLNLQFDKSNLKLVGKFLALRYTLGLALGLLLFWLLPFEDMFRYTLLICFILPTATTSLAYSVEFKYDTKLVGTIANMTIIISFILLWLIANLIL
ncbi:AEC family transporter [Sediminibacillus massiliensis]|uniref:AEC family transporter n=1 Tax=Sediminibacillus massiliensis TaxID=1926277 RepID=UPI0009885470|nr:AEC family transporter [Sediminibacillus massiliensis]